MKPINYLYIEMKQKRKWKLINRLIPLNKWIRKFILWIFYKKDPTIPVRCRSRGGGLVLFFVPMYEVYAVNRIREAQFIRIKDVLLLRLYRLRNAKGKSSCQPRFNPKSVN